MKSLRLWLFPLIVAAFANVDLSRTPAGSPEPLRHVEIIYSCEITDLPAGTKSVELWMPMPSDNERQTVRLLEPTDVAPARITVDPTFGNQIYYRSYDSPPAGEPLRVELRYDATFREHEVPEAKALISTSQVTPSDELSAYLRPVRSIPLDGKIATLAAQVPLPKGEPLRAARAFYDHLIDTMVYNYKAPGAGQGDAVWACDSKTGDCTDYHSVFIGLCRRRGIPADHVFGLPMPLDKPTGEMKYAHCWARFWVADVGWTTIDASMADKQHDLRDYYFGTLSSTWLTLSHGRDVVLEPPQHGPPINMFDEPIVEVDGREWEHVKWLGKYRTLSDGAE